MVALVDRLLLLLSVSISAFCYDQRLGSQPIVGALEATISPSGQDSMLMRRQSSDDRTDADTDLELDNAKREAASFSEQLKAARAKGDREAKQQLSEHVETDQERRAEIGLERLRKAMHDAEASVANLKSVKIPPADNADFSSSLVQIDGDGDDDFDSSDDLELEAKKVSLANSPSALALQKIENLAHQASDEAEDVSSDMQFSNYSVEANQLKENAKEDVWKATHLFPDTTPAQDQNVSRDKAIKQLEAQGDEIAKMVISTPSEENGKDSSETKSEFVVASTPEPTADDLRKEGEQHLQAAENAFPVPPKIYNDPVDAPTVWQRVAKEADVAMRLTSINSTMDSKVPSEGLVQLNDLDAEPPTPLPLYMNDTGLRLAAAKDQKASSFEESVEESSKKHDERAHNLQDASFILDEAAQELDKDSELDQPAVPMSTGPSGAELLRDAMNGVQRPPTAAELLVQHRAQR